MPQIIPIKDLKNTSEISDMCHRAEEPIYITENGYGDMVIMSMEIKGLFKATESIVPDIGNFIPMVLMVVTGVIEL